MVTFGFTLLVTDVAIMIMTYYSVIGGWITEYLAVYLAGQGVYAAEEGYFTSFITSEVYPIIFMLLFLAITAFIVYSFLKLHLMYADTHTALIWRSPE